MLPGNRENISEVSGPQTFTSAHRNFYIMDRGIYGRPPCEHPVIQRREGALTLEQVEQRPQVRAAPKPFGQFIHRRRSDARLSVQGPQGFARGFLVRRELGYEGGTRHGSALHLYFAFLGELLQQLIRERSWSASVQGGPQNLGPHPWAEGLILVMSVHRFQHGRARARDLFGSEYGPAA